MKIIFGIIFGLLCFNLATFILEGYPTIMPGYQPLTGMNATQAISGWDLNSTKSAGSTSGTLTVFNYIKEAQGLFDRLTTIVDGVSKTAEDLHAPSGIVTAIKVLTGFIWVLFFVELFAGRDVMD